MTDTTFIKSTGSRLYPFYQATDGANTGGRRIFFFLTDYRNNVIVNQLELTHRSFGFYTEPDDSELTFPTGYDFVFEKYYPRLSDGISHDTSVPVEITAVQLINPPLGTLTGRISRTTFVQSENRVQGVIGSDIIFNVFVTNNLSNSPADLGIFSKIDALFCGLDGNAVIVDIVPTERQLLGYLIVQVPEEKSVFLDPTKSDFDLRLYSGDAVVAVVPFRNALQLFDSVCNV